MHVPLFIARRYLFSKRLPTAVNVLAWISVVGIGLGTTALVLVLSVFNGFQQLIQGVFADFDPEIRIVAARDKFVPAADSIIQLVQKQPDVAQALPALEGRAILSYGDKQVIIQLKGVDTAYAQLTRVGSLVQYGSFQVETPDSVPLLVMGAGVAVRIGTNLMDDLTPHRLLAVTGEGNLLTNPEEAVRQVNAYPAGIFSIHKEYDDRVVLTSLSAARQLFAQPTAVSAIELRLNEGTDLEAARIRLQASLGPRYDVQTWYGQHQTLYQVLRNEKAVGYLVLTLMLLLAACTIVGNLTMVVLDKQGDIALLRAAGASARRVRAIFLWQGLLTGLWAAGGGLLLGGLIGWLQQTFGLLRMAGGASFLVQSFPLQMQGSDFVLIFATVLVLALLSSLYPAWRAAQGLPAQRFRA